MADNVDNTGGEQAPEFTEIEQRALDQGWRPKDEWDGEPDAWRSAKEFVDRGELFRKIDEQNRTIKEFKRSLDELSRHHADVRAAEYKRARQELLAQKEQALEENNARAVVQIDEKLEAVREAQVAAAKPAVQAEPVLNPVFVQWKEKNSWYGVNEPMTAYADRIGNQLGAGGGWAPEGLLAEIERRVKKEFATKFENPRRTAAAGVEAGGTKGSGSKKDSYEMSSTERAMMQRFVKNVPGMTEEKYIADLKLVDAMLKKN